MRTLHFRPVVCSFFLSFFLSSPNLSPRILDVYHTSTHGVALVRIQNACLKCAACGSLDIRDPQNVKNSPSGHHRTTLSGYIFACIDNRKKLVKQQYLPHMFSQYDELRPTNDWDPFGSLGHPGKFQRVSRVGSVTARRSSSGHQPNFAALNRRRHLYQAGRPSRWPLAHILVMTYFTNLSVASNALASCSTLGIVFELCFESYASLQLPYSSSSSSSSMRFIIIVNVNLGNYQCILCLAVLSNLLYFLYHMYVVLNKQNEQTSKLLIHHTQSRRTIDGECHILVLLASSPLYNL